MHWRCKRQFRLVYVTPRAKRDLLGPSFLPQGKEHVGALSYPSCAVCNEKDPPPSHPSRTLKCPEWLEDREQLGERQLWRVPWRVTRTTDPTSHFVDPQEACHRATGVLQLKIHPASLWAPPSTLPAAPAHTHPPMADPPGTYVPDGSEGKTWETASKHTQASLTLQDWEKGTKAWAFSTRGEQMQVCPHPA